MRWQVPPPPLICYFHSQVCICCAESHWVNVDVSNHKRTWSANWLKQWSENHDCNPNARLNCVSTVTSMRKINTNTQHPHCSAPSRNTPTPRHTTPNDTSRYQHMHWYDLLTTNRVRHDIELAKRADRSLAAAEHVLRDVIHHAAKMASVSRANFSNAFGHRNKDSEPKQQPWPVRIIDCAPDCSRLIKFSWLGDGISQ